MALVYEASLYSLYTDLRYSVPIVVLPGMNQAFSNLAAFAITNCCIAYFETSTAWQGSRTVMRCDNNPTYPVNNPKLSPLSLCSAYGLHQWLVAESRS